MDLFPSADQDALIAAARDVLRGELPAQPGNEARALRLFGDLGWYLLGLPEESGGVGYGPAEEALLLLEAGRHLAPINLMAGMLGGRLAMMGGRTDLAQAIGSGECNVAFGLASESPGAPAVLLSATDAQFILMIAWNHALLYPIGAITRRHNLPCLDETVALEQATIDSEAAISHQDGPGIACHRDVLAAAYLAGMAEQTMALAVQHACTREQFGQPIGAFQAVKHPCADMAVRCEAAHWQTMIAAISIAGTAPDATYQTNAAISLALAAAFANTAAAIQIFGGMGYAADCPVHRFLKRTHVIERLVGGAGARLQSILETAAPDTIRR
jgi:alkylation response protein AidB-like acyl-CoA dehydrogenase